jgi:hypothetical protein
MLRLLWLGNRNVGIVTGEKRDCVNNYAKSAHNKKFDIVLRPPRKER